MAIEQLPNEVKITRPDQAKPLPYTRREVFWDGVTRAGLKETSWSYLADTLEARNAKNNPQFQQLTEDEFYDLPGITADMEYYPGMTVAQANLYIDEVTRQMDYMTMKQNADFYAPAYYMLGSFAGTLPDPVNIIPFGMPIKGAKWTVNALRAAGANAAIETGLQPLAYTAYKARGDDYDYTDFARNVMFAAGAGAGLSAFFSGAKGLVNKLDSFALMGHEARTVEGVQTRLSKGKYEIDDEFVNVMNAGQTTIASLASNNVRNADPFTRSRSYIDTTGEIHASRDLTKTATSVETAVITGEFGGKMITGSNDDILKTLKYIKKYLRDDEQITVKRNDKPGNAVRLNKNEIDSFVEGGALEVNRRIFGADQPKSQFRDIYNSITSKFKNPFVADLDDNFGFTSKEIDGVRYQFEFETRGDRQGFDPNTGLGRIYVLKNGRRKLLSQDKASQVYKKIKEIGLEAQVKDTGRATVDTSRSLESQVLEGTDATSTQNKAVEAASNDKANEQVEGTDGKLKTAEELGAEGTDPKLIVKKENIGETFNTFLKAPQINVNKLAMRFNEQTGKIDRVDEVYNTLGREEKQAVLDFIKDFDKATQSKQAPEQGVKNRIKDHQEGKCN
jgi:hypothetical protein